MICFSQAQPRKTEFNLTKIKNNILIIGLTRRRWVQFNDKNLKMTYFSQAQLSETEFDLTIKIKMT